MKVLGVPCGDPKSKKRCPKAVKDAQSESFEYDFALTPALKGKQVQVNAILHFRHVSPYFLRALGDFYPPGITAKALVENLRVVDMASARLKNPIKV
jgi:hypothetical protein